ncbi:titin-like isoform X2 [Centruroides sculpturatus]|uniref:titin-like isoform X2 n=1 Tax=Centruroides sculpturatus TaxID=218467 RepID=UPI000C6DC871|nr:titin-like isoform X2 [Centruroides sculpturatus]
MLRCKLSCLLLCIYILIACISEVKGKGKKVIGILGSSAELPCEVDVEKCGEVFYTTWAKEISNEWKRIYFNDGGRMEKGLQELAFPDKAKFFMNDSSAYLRISYLRIEDEGSYRCDVTYTKPCPSLTFSSLIIQVRPSPPEIQHEDKLIEHGTIIGPFQEKSVLSLDCESQGGKPTAKVTWWKDDESLDSDISYTNNSYGSKDIKSSIDLTLSRDDIGTRLMCRVENEALDKPLESWVEVDLNVKPISLEISGPTEPVQEGDIISLNCTVEGAKPAAEITWYNESNVLIPSPESETEKMPDNTYRTISELEIEVTKFDHKGIFYCEGSNDLIKEEPLLESFSIEVEYPPAVVIEPEKGIIVNETTEAVFTCSYEANPETILDIDWYKDGKELPLSDSTKYSTSNTTMPTLTILSVDRNDRGIYTCSLTNSIGRGNSSNSVKLTVLYPPEVEVVISPSVINERDSAKVSLFCEIIGGNPQNLLRIRWYKNDEFLNEVTDKKISWMEITRNFSGNYSCEAENAAGWGNRSENEELIVHYLPGEADIIEEGEPTKRGESVNLTCEVEELGLPEAESYYWELDGEVLDTNNKTLIIDDADLHHEGNYSCSAVNDVGSGEKGYHFLDIKVPPKFIIKLPKLHGASRDASFYNVTCRVECDPICEIEWLKNGESIMDSNYYIITKENLPEEEENDYFSSVISVLRWNMTAWPGGKLERERDSANYTCRSTDNEVGPEVESTMQFSVEYAPENVEISQNLITLEEGDEFEPINCSASSWPLSTYRWKFGNFIVNDGSTLDLNEVTRKDAGIYTCEARNSRGKAEAEMILEIRYIPNCDIVRDDDDDETILKCESDAYSEVKYYWTKDNNTLDDDIDIDDDNSTIRFKRYEEEFYGEYECIVENNMGESEPCAEIVTKPEGYGDTIWDPETGEKKIFIIAAIVGGIAILFLIIIVVIIILMRRRRRAVICKPCMEELQSDTQLQTGMPKQQVHVTIQTNGSPILKNTNAVTTLRRMEDKRRRLRSIADASAAKAAAPETLYQNIEAADHKENGLSESESKPMYENMPFFGRTKGLPTNSTAILYSDLSLTPINSKDSNRKDPAIEYAKLTFDKDRYGYKSSIPPGHQ